jgi:type 1 fimbria pilin
MTQWNPVWKVEIDGVEYTDAVLANLTIRSGRTNIYEQAQAGYVNLQLIDIAQTTIPVSINSTIGVQIKDTSGAFVAIFGGNVVDIGLEVRDVGSSTFTQTYNITALGALARLPKVIFTDALARDFDGDQILAVLSEVLYNQWQQVAGSLTWATYPATTTWATAENNGLGEIDTPGNYDLSARGGGSDPIDVYSLVAALATSGLGYIYEDSLGRIGYADSTHRTNYLAANGYVDLDANHARAAGLRIETRVGDVRNAITILYGANSQNDVSDSDPASISIYGNLAQIITTTLHDAGDASAQAAFYLSLRANPQPIFSQISFDLTNPEIDDADRDNLLNVFMGEAIALSNLPLNMNSGTFQGFVEGWSFQASYNQLSVTLLLSPLAYSLQAMRWNDVPITETWNSVSPTLDWENATIVA